MTWNWNALFIIVLGGVLLLIGWQGTHNRVWQSLTNGLSISAFGNSSNPGQTPPGVKNVVSQPCQSGSSLSVLCPNGCMVQDHTRILGYRCIPQITKPNANVGGN